MRRESNMAVPASGGTTTMRPARSAPLPPPSPSPGPVGAAATWALPITRRHLMLGACLLLAAAAALGAAWMNPTIEAQRRDYHLGPPGQMTPMVSFKRAALGPIRGIWLSVAFYQANQLKQEGRHFAADQLANEVAELEPTYPHIWTFLAWNMAYNHSVMTYTPQERWDWVSKGIRLLRDKAIPLNPNSVHLHRELAQIWWHKVGANMDDMHQYYKRRVAEEWQTILGAPTQSGTTKQAIDAMQAIADAPDTLAELRAKEPGVDAFIDALSKVPHPDDPSRVGYQLDYDGLVAIGQVLMRHNITNANALPEEFFRASDSYRREDAILPLLTGDQNRAGRAATLAFLRKRVLIDHYHMDPVAMVRAMQTYGPLDWRTPGAHALYWANEGFNRAPTAADKDVDLVNTYRMVQQALQSMIASGQVVYDPFEDYVQYVPDLRFMVAYFKAYDHFVETWKVKSAAEEQGWTKGAMDSFENAADNFMAYYVFPTAYFSAQEYAPEDHVPSGPEIYEMWKQRFGSAERNKKYAGLTFDERVLYEMNEAAQNRELMLNLISSNIAGALVDGVAVNRLDVANRRIEFARDFYANYQKKDLASRNVLPPFEVLEQNVLLFVLIEPTYNLQTRYRIWQWMTDDLRRVVWDRVRIPLYAQAQAMGFIPEKMFPEPPGMEEYRKAHPVAPPAKGPAPALGPAGPTANPSDGTGGETKSP